MRVHVFLDCELPVCLQIQKNQSLTYMVVNYLSKMKFYQLNSFNINIGLVVVYLLILFHGNQANAYVNFKKDNYNFLSKTSIHFDRNEHHFKISRGIKGENKIWDSFVIGFSKLKQEKILITGMVTDQEGVPVPGVNITVEGTSKGTTTNFEGGYEIEIEAGDRLTFKAMGFEEYNVVVEEEDELNVALKEESEKLKEVVVTALGIEKEEKSVGYAVQDIKGEELEEMNKTKEPNLLTNLTGKIAGLTIRNTSDVFREPSIDLRGEKPLLVIDGIPDRTGDYWKLNSDEIENISVLKGPSASALYGSVGKDGAIMITTKKGEKGKMRVSMSNSTQFQTSFLRVPNVQTEYGTGNNGKYEYVDGSGAGIEGGGWMWGPKLDQEDPNTESGFWETPQYNSPVDPNTGELAPLPFISRGKDNIKNFFRTGLLQSNNLSLDWGNDKSNFRLSFSNDYQRGIVPNSDLKKTSLSLSGGINPIENLNITSSLKYNKEYTNNYPNIGYGTSNYLYNLILWTGADVDVRDERDYWVEGQEGYQQKNWNTGYYNNPWFIANEYTRPYFKDNVVGRLNADYLLHPKLKLKSSVGVNYYGLNNEVREAISVRGGGGDMKGQFRQTNGDYFDITSEIGLEYNDDITKDISLTAEGHFSNFYREHKQTEVQTDGLSVPGLYTLSNSIGDLKAPSGSNFKNYEMINSAYGFIDLDFYDTFFLNATGRFDKVSTLPKGNNSYFYPSISGSLLVDKIFELPYWIDMFKLRGSLAQVSTGKIGGDVYGYINSFNELDTKWQGKPAFYYGSTIIDPNLKPETSDQWEVGTNIILLKNRFNFDFAYFHNRDYRNLIETPLSEASGYTSFTTNGNEYERKGVELSLNVDILRDSDFKWSTSINLSHYKRVLTKIFEDKDRDGDLQVGDRTDKIFYDPYETSPDGEVVIDNGLPVNSNRPYPRSLGYSKPDWVYGNRHTLSFKNFSLSTQFDGVIGGKMFSQTNERMWYGGTTPESVNQYRVDANNGKDTYIVPGVKVVDGSISYNGDGTIKEDTREFETNDVPVNYNAYNQNHQSYAENNYHYYKQTFIKLRELTLTYNLPTNFVEDLNIASASVSLIGRNLWMSSKIKNVDPDSGSDELQTPAMRTVGFNVNLTF